MNDKINKRFLIFIPIFAAIFVVAGFSFLFFRQPASLVDLSQSYGGGAYRQ